MTLFRCTLLLFAFFSISTAAPAPHQGRGVSTYERPPWSPPEPGWVYYIHSESLDGWYKDRSFGILPVVALNAPESGKMVVVEIAPNLPCLSNNQKGAAFEYFPDNTELKFAGQARSLKSTLPDQIDINLGIPRTIDIKNLRWDKGGMLTVQMEKQGFDTVSGLLEAGARRSGKVFVPVPNYRQTPPHLSIGLDDNTAKGLVGWVYYADSSLWNQHIGTVPVVVIGTPGHQQAVVVEIGQTLPYLRDQTQKRPASRYFKKGTGLSFGDANFVSLATEDIWMNIAKPRMLNINALKWDSAKATAQMEGYDPLP